MFSGYSPIYGPSNTQLHVAGLSLGLTNIFKDSWCVILHLFTDLFFSSKQVPCSILFCLARFFSVNWIISAFRQKKLRLLGNFLRLLHALTVLWAPQSQCDIFSAGAVRVCQNFWGGSLRSVLWIPTCCFFYLNFDFNVLDRLCEPLPASSVHISCSWRVKILLEQRVAGLCIWGQGALGISPPLNGWGLCKLSCVLSTVNVFSLFIWFPAFS